MGQAQLRDNGTVFLCRVAGVAVDRDRVLLHRSEHDSFWALPGGRIEVGEDSATALHREMQEEVGAVVRVGRLLWVIENFFSHYPLDRPPDTSEAAPHHEIGFYLHMELPTYLTSESSFAGREVNDTEHEFALEFRWFDRTGLGELDIRPATLRQLLSQPLPDGVPTLVSRD